MRKIIAVAIYWCLNVFVLKAQTNRAQYPKILSKAYFGLDAGYIHYPFTNDHLAEGYKASLIEIPRPALRFTLLGYRFTPNISAKITYMRPVEWMRYTDINGSKRQHTVWMNVGGLTIKGETNNRKRFSAYGEAGLGLITRKGFKIDDIGLVKNAEFASVLTSFGVQYNVNDKWSSVAAATFSPQNKKEKQPQTLFYSAGFVYRMKPLDNEIVNSNTDSTNRFAKQSLQISKTTNALGYGVNEVFYKGIVPIFWGGHVKIKDGFSVTYQRNIFHTKSVFSLDVGASIGQWKTVNNDEFYSASLFPVLRFTALRTKPLDAYLYYSVAGPTFLSKKNIDEYLTGRKFTFRDFMGLGTYIGKNRKLNAEISIGHFSNGNLFPDNPGVQIPLTFSAGYVF